MVASLFPRPVAAVVLDLDGTLLDTEIVYVRAWLDAMAEFGQQFPESFLHGLIGGPRAAFHARLHARLGPDFPYAEHRARYVALRRARMAAGVELKPGAEALLARIASLGLPMAIATAATRAHAGEQLARSGLERYFAAVLTRDDVENTKPSPDLFIRAAAALAVPAGNCMAVEDSPNGVRAAVAAGMMTVMVPDIVDPDDEMRAICISVEADLHRVAALLREPVQGATSGG